MVSVKGMTIGSKDFHKVAQKAEEEGEAIYQVFDSLDTLFEQIPLLPTDTYTEVVKDILEEFTP